MDAVGLFRHRALLGPRDYEKSVVLKLKKPNDFKAIYQLSEARFKPESVASIVAQHTNREITAMLTDTCTSISEDKLL